MGDVQGGCSLDGERKARGWRAWIGPGWRAMMEGNEWEQAREEAMGTEDRKQIFGR